jgi:hypothetical protein
VIHYELLKASSSEAIPVINYSLNLIVSAICEKNGNVQGLVACIKKILINESQNVPILHHISLFLIKYNTVSCIKSIIIVISIKTKPFVFIYYFSCFTLSKNSCSVTF